MTLDQEKTHQSTEIMLINEPIQNGESIVISGMSGLYPKSRDIKEFSDLLYNKVNPITPEGLRFEYKHPEVAQQAGSVPDVDKFDAPFFKMRYHVTLITDPTSRKMMEQVYQAIYDAGVCPEQLSRSNVGVYVGNSCNEYEKSITYNSRLALLGCNKAMFSNRISYWLNVNGPSVTVDSACCSSATALQLACQAISRGNCDAAVVAGGFLCLHPQTSIHFGRTIKLCADGRTKSFDQNADGCAISEAVNVLFLQKAKDALRVYAEVVHIKSEFTTLSEDETRSNYGFYRNPKLTTKFLKTFYEAAQVPPREVQYVEAFGCADPEVDKSELISIGEVFCTDRDNPLLVGSVKSNIGYCESATSISAITKVLLGFHRGELAANLHCSEPRCDVDALRDGSMRIVTEHQPFQRTYAAVNGMSICGGNSHVLLHGRYKPKDLTRYKCSIPYLVNISTRQEKSLEKVFNHLKSQPIDPEMLTLLHNVHQHDIPGHLGRGFIILDNNENNETISLCEQKKHFDSARRPLWFVYSGMGSQWTGMGAQLMRMPIFAAAIERCQCVMKPKGINIIDIITTSDENTFNNICYSFVGIAAIQIGLTDVLHALGLVPDGIIGHSVGELGCAYADGCLTSEEMILSAYSRGQVSLQTPFIHGSMAAVGLGYEQIKSICPPEIDVACHNGPDSCTISGPSGIMKEFVAQLTAKQVFAKEVPCANIAYHSRYISKAGPALLKYLEDVITTKKLRSHKWISTSVPKEKWDMPCAKYSSAEYYTNNLLNPVLFEEASRLIPNNAVLVEVSPHGLLQAILKRSLSADSVSIALTKRKHPDNAYLLLEAIGHLYTYGYNPKIQVLYPKIEFPVSTGTSHLSHLVEWAHGEVWPTAAYNSAQRKQAAVFNDVISLHDKEHSYLRGHVIKGQILYPFAVALVNVWDTFCMSLGEPKKQLSVMFSNVELYTQPPLHDERQLRISVALHRGTGSFEVLLDEHSKIASGFIVLSNVKDTRPQSNSILEAHQDGPIVPAKDIYYLLKERGYSYSDEFCSLNSASSSLNEAFIEWHDNWPTLIDGMLQLNMLRQAHDGLTTPTHIKSLRINVNAHNISKILKKNKILMKAEVLDNYDFTRCGGVLMENIKFNYLPLLKEVEMGLHTLKFVPYFHSTLDIYSLLRVYYEIVGDELNKKNIKVVGIRHNCVKGDFFNDTTSVVTDIDGIFFSYEEIILEKQNQLPNDFDLLLVKNLSTDTELRQQLRQVLQHDVFIVTEEEVHENPSSSASLYKVLSTHAVKGTDRKLELVKWKPTPAPRNIKHFTVQKIADFTHLETSLTGLPPSHRFLISVPFHLLTEIKAHIYSWRKILGPNKIFLIAVITEEDFAATEKLPDNGLTFNVINKGILGGVHYMPSPKALLINKAGILQSEKYGDFNSLIWAETPDPVGPEILVTVQYAGINQKDIKKASGALLFERDSCNGYGMDFSGRTESGERVMGIVRSGACSSRVRAVPELLWPVPAHWSLEDAATVPLAYAHAFYCLAIKSQLRPGMKVLVHGGAGGLGQAVISIALAYRCQVCTTVSDSSKKRFLLKTFPDLKDENIGISRDHVGILNIVANATQGTGCDLIISTAKSGLKHTTMTCCGIQGKVIDVTQLVDQENVHFGMYHLNSDQSYIITDFSSILTMDNKRDMKKLQMMLSEGIVRGYVRPLSRVTYALHDAPRAFRLLAASRHYGRVLLHISDAPQSMQLRMFCDPQSTHLVFCEDNMLGVQLADLLVTRGARKLIIHHKLPPNVIFQIKKRLWQELGVEVMFSSRHLSTNEEMSTFFEEFNSIGPIEGVYVATGSKDINNIESLVSNLDIVSTKLCPNIKYFAVVTIGDITGKHTCLSREQRKLPALTLSLPKVVTCGSWRHCAMDAFERALCNSHAVQLAHVLPVEKPTLPQNIGQLADLPISEIISNNKNLRELGVEADKLDLSRNVLLLQHDESCDKENLSPLTIRKIVSMDKETIYPYKNIKGLSTFYTYAEPDELLAVTDMVLLPTLASSHIMRDDEFDASLAHLYLVTGMEGHHERFRLLCERLKLPALVLQPGLDNPHETPRQLAQRYAEVLLKKAEIKNNFYLLGYEIGVAVVLEIAAILEDLGLTGTVFCIGYGPEEVKAEINEQLGEYDTEEKLQNAIVLHMYKLMGGDQEGVLEDKVKSINTWSQKVDACVQFLVGRAQHSAQYIHALNEAALARTSQALRHSAESRPLRSRLVLLRAATSCTPAPPTSLQRHSQLPVAVHQLKAPFAHATADLRCATIINEYLDPSILEEFNNRNRCSTYLINPDAFIMEL